LDDGDESWACLSKAIVAENGAWSGAEAHFFLLAVPGHECPLPPIRRFVLGTNMIVYSKSELIGTTEIVPSYKAASVLFHHAEGRLLLA
jgi:hypothetical protein